MKQDVIVIGAGIIGLATAEQLLLLGAEVTLVERNKVGCESSWAGGGILSPLNPWEYPDDFTRFTNYSASMFPQWIPRLHQASGIDPQYIHSGMRVLPPFDKNIVENWCKRHEVRLEFEDILPTDIAVNRQDHLGISNNNNQSAILPEIAQVRNPKLLKALHERILQLGGRAIENCSVNRLKTLNHKICALDTSQGEMVSDHYVLCAGAWSQQLLDQHASNIHIKPIKGQMLLFKFDQPPIDRILVKKDIYLIPRQDGYLLVGSTLEDVGFDKKTTTSAREYLLAKAQEILPALNAMPIIKQWAGLRPASTSPLPFIGRHPILRNLLICTGHFRYGITLAPASAEILVNEMTGHAQNFDVSLFQPK